MSAGALEAAPKHDLDARRLLQCAQGAFQKWPEGFAGFSATIRCRDGKHAVSGMVTVLAGGHVELDLADGGGLVTWTRGALAAISAARTPRFFKDGDGRFPITFEAEDQHRLGRRVRVHLGAERWRVYRIDARGRIRQQESAWATSRTAATYDAFVRACPGRVLPTRIQVLDWNASTHTVVETTEIEDAYERCEHVWLPVQRRAVVVRGDARRELGFELRNHLVL
jgi:hypothetical protein